VASNSARFSSRIIIERSAATLIMLLIGFWLAINLVQSPTQFFQSSIIGISNGVLYALIALGYTLVYGIIELINFAHGDLFMLGGLFAATFIAVWFGQESPSSVGYAVFFACLIASLILLLIENILIFSDILSLILFIKSEYSDFREWKKAIIDDRPIRYIGMRGMFIVSKENPSNWNFWLLGLIGAGLILLLNFVKKQFERMRSGEIDTLFG
jgi:CBS domain containing-hemolysin-like protein